MSEVSIPTRIMLAVLSCFALAEVCSVYPQGVSFLFGLTFWIVWASVEAVVLSALGQTDPFYEDAHFTDRNGFFIVSAAAYFASCRPVVPMVPLTLSLIPLWLLGRSFCRWLQSRHDGFRPPPMPLDFITPGALLLEAGVYQFLVRPESPWPVRVTLAAGVLWAIALGVLKARRESDGPTYYPTTTYVPVVPVVPKSPPPPVDDEIIEEVIIRRWRRGKSATGNQATPFEQPEFSVQQNPDRYPPLDYNNAIDVLGAPETTYLPAQPSDKKRLR